MVVGDGEQVEIPVPPLAQEGCSDTGGQAEQADGRACASTKAGEGVKYTLSMQRCDADRKQVWKLLNPHWREKLLLSEEVPVPQTDTGR